MKTSSEIASCARLVGEEKAVEYLAKAGFDAWDFSMFVMAEMDWDTNSVIDCDHPLRKGDYLGFARKLRHIGEECGIVCNQAHAPFPSDRPEINSYLKRAIECAAEAGAEICVVHPGAFLTPEQNAELYGELLPFAKEHGVKIATENMWAWDNEKGHSAFAACATSEDFCAHIDVVNDPFFVACLDIGHAEMKGSGSGAANMIRALGHRLQALHVHDNDKLRDYHQIPFSMNIDFAEVIKALREIGYSGYLTLEADSFLRKYTAETAFDGVKELAASAKKLAAMFEE